MLLLPVGMGIKLAVGLVIWSQCFIPDVELGYPYRQEDTLTIRACDSMNGGYNLPLFGRGFVK